MKLLTRVSAFGLACVLAGTAAASEDDGDDAPALAPDSISEVMLEDTGLELEDTAVAESAPNAAAKDPVAAAGEEVSAPVPARAAPSP